MKSSEVTGRLKQQHIEPVPGDARFSVGDSDLSIGSDIDQLWTPTFHAYDSSAFMLQCVSAHGLDDSVPTGVAMTLVSLMPVLIIPFTVLVYKGANLRGWL